MTASERTINELAQLCAYSTDEHDWAAFLDAIRPLTYTVAGRIVRMWTGTATPHLVEDICQELYLKLCEQERRILRSFEPRGDDSFLGLLRLVTTSVGNDYFRRQSSAKRGGQHVVAQLEEEHASQHHSTDQLHRILLFQQLDERLTKYPELVSERDRNLFWLYYRHGYTADEISRLLNGELTPKGVESALRRMAQWLKSELHTDDQP